MSSTSSNQPNLKSIQKSILPLAPASFFAMTLGLAETGNAWRNATALWHLPALVGEILELLAIVSFLWWLLIYVNKWMNYREAAKQELKDPVQASFIALIPESIILVALAILPYTHSIAVYIFWIGSILNLIYGAFRLSNMWIQEREPSQTTPSLFLTYTASILVNALVAGIFGYANYGFALLGIGTISWLIMDSVITQQLTVRGLAAKTRNFMGIYMAPPVVLLVAYQVLTRDNGILSITYALTGYAIFITISLTFSFRWLMEQSFAPGYWAYTFGIATLAQGTSLFAMREPNVVINGIAIVSFVLTNIIIIPVAIGSVRLLLKGNYFPK